MVVGAELGDVAAIARIIHVGRNKVAQVLAGTAQTHLESSRTLLEELFQIATAVPAGVARRGGLVPAYKLMNNPG